MSGESSYNFGVVAAQLVEAAHCALRGDGDSTRERIGRAAALLHDHTQSGSVPLRGYGHASPVFPRPVRAEARLLARGTLAGWRAKRVVSHIESNLATSLRVAELARLIGLSSSHFCRAFKRTFGVPVHAYLVHRRIELAQGLMLETGAPLSEIALKCGMSDQAHFTRSFRRVVGETPHSWRCARRETMLAAG